MPKKNKCAVLLKASILLSELEYNKKIDCVYNIVSCINWIYAH